MNAPHVDLRIDQDYIDVTSDLPDWRYVDAAGHGHFFDSGYPTLRWVPQPCTMGHDECEAEGYYECPLCEEQIAPKTRMGSRKSIPGQRTYTLLIQRPDSRREYVFGDGQWAEAVAALESSLADYRVSEVRSR